MTHLDTVADELYGLPAREFTAARDRLAADIRKTGDRDLAGAVKKLRRPTATAWLANQLARQTGDQVAELLDTGEALRRAQGDLDVEAMRRQTQAGQQQVAELARQARRIADDAGESVSDQVVRELEETLHAGLVDPGASEAIRSGRLTTSLHYSGFGLLDGPGSDEAATGEPTTAATRPAEAPPRARGRKPAGPEVEAARQARQDAEAELAGARRHAAEVGRRVDQARKRQDTLRQRIRRLDEELEQLRSEEAEAGDAVAAAAQDRRAADDQVAHAEALLDRLLDGLQQAP